MSDSRYTEYLTIDTEFWQLQYLGRKVNEQYSDMFDHNGYYPSDDYDKYPEYDKNDIIINIQLNVVDDVVEDISYYKKVDRGLYYRGHTSRSLNAHDINVFREILDACTISQAPAILDSLLNLPLKEGWSVKRVSEKTISLFNGEKTFSLPVDYAKTIIDVARNYPDIRDNDDFWEINKKYLREKYKHTLFALLHSFDKEHFPQIDFRETAKERIDRENQVEAVEKELTIAIDKNQSEKACELVNKIAFVPLHAIEIAIKKKRAKILLSFISVIDNSFELKSIGEYAISSGKTDLLKSVLDKNSEGLQDLIYIAYKKHRIDYVLLLLEKGYVLHIRPENRTRYKPEQLLPLVGHQGVYYSAKILEQLFQAYGCEPIKAIIDNYNFSINFLDEKGYSLDERYAFVNWLLEKKNIELIDYAVEKGIIISVSSHNEENLAIKLFNEGGEMWEHGKELFSGNISYSRCLSENNMALLHYLVEHVSVTENVLRYALEYRHSTDQEMIKELIKHLDLSTKEERTPGKLPLWHYALHIEEISLFELFFEKYNNILNDEERQEIYHDFVWYEHDVERAKILAKTCNVSESIIIKSELASVLHPGKALSLVEEEYFKGKERKKHIYPHKVSFHYYDDHTWEIKGLPSIDKYDTPDLQDLHYLVSVDGDNYIVKSLNE